jgi:hypothetical protein
MSIGYLAILQSVHYFSSFSLMLFGFAEIVQCVCCPISVAGALTLPDYPVVLVCDKVCICQL